MATSTTTPASFLKGLRSVCEELERGLDDLEHKQNVVARKTHEDGEVADQAEVTTDI